ncbi:MAG: OmpA family protein [Bacteroidaceae bacterium]|nr:OmpA family protein [Bacteroidaceae bacterium]
MKTKLLTIALAALSAFGLTANAQDTFYPGFQWGVKGGAGYTVGETSNFGKLISPAAGIDLGYQFTPVFTLRADIAGWQGKAVYLENPWTMNYAHLSADAVFDICNMVDFKAGRVVNPYFFAGIGAHLRFNNKADSSTPGVTIPTDHYYWDGTKASYVGRLGVGVNFRVNDLLGIFVEVADNATDDRFNSKKGEFFDQQITGMVGVKFTIGQARKARAAAAAVAAAEADKAAAEAERLAARKAEAERIAAEKAAAEKGEAERPAAERASAAKAEAERIAAEKAEAERPAAQRDAACTREGALAAAVEAAKDESNDIFFTSEKYNVTASEQAKIDDFVEKLNADPDAKAILCAFADKATGTHDYNMALSEKRAASVAKVLEAKGIDKSRIIIHWYGDTIQIFETSHKNRVCVMICK